METTKQAAKRDGKTSLPLSSAAANSIVFDTALQVQLDNGLSYTNALLAARRAMEAAYYQRLEAKPEPVVYPSTYIVHYVSLGRFCQLGCTSLDGALKTVKALASDGVKGLIEVL